MRTNFIILLFCFLIHPCIQAQATIGIDSIYKFIKINSAWSRAANWNELDSMYQLSMQKAINYTDSLSVLSEILYKIDGHSSYFIYENDRIDIAKNAKSSNAGSSLMKKVLEDHEKIIRTKFQRGVAYIRLSGFFTNDSTKLKSLAQSIYDSIVLYNPVDVKAYILDLRLLSGGQLEPILAGLMPLLGNGVFAKESDPSGRIVHTWSINDHFLEKDGKVLYRLSDRKIKGYDTKPLAILIGPATASCGKLVAIAFKRRSLTEFFGENTSDDFSGILSTIKFNEELQLILASNFFSDRSNSIYPEHISPDQWVSGGDKFDRLLFDKKVKAAFEWISTLKM